MDVRLSPEQRALQETAVRVVADLGPGTVAGLDDLPRQSKLDAAVVDAGWRQLRTAASPSGEPWATGVELAIIAEELGKGPADTPFLGPTLAAELRRLAGAPASEEPETVLLATDLGRIAHDDDAPVAIDSAGARAALGLAAHEGGWSLTRVPLAPSSIGVDLTRPSADPSGPAMTVADQTRPLTDDDVERVGALGLAISCADLVGAMHGAIDLTVAYVTERSQYGRPVGAFQAVQHLLADAFVTTEGSRSVTLHAAWAVDALPTADALVAASGAKAYVARSARSACEAAIQAHGGIGNTWECMVHVHLRRVLLSSDLFGGVDASLARLLAHHEIELH